MPITETGFGLCWFLLERTMRKPCAVKKSIYRNHARTMRGPFLLVGPSLASFWGYHCCCLSNSSNSSNSSSVAAAAAVLLPQQDQCCCLSSSSNSSSAAAAAGPLLLLLPPQNEPQSMREPCANHARTMRELTNPAVDEPATPWRPVGGQFRSLKSSMWIFRKRYKFQWICMLY